MIDVNGPLSEYFNPTSYCVSWLKAGHHFAFGYCQQANHLNQKTVVEDVPSFCAPSYQSRRLDEPRAQFDFLQLFQLAIIIMKMSCFL